MADLATWNDVQARLLDRTLTAPQQATVTVWIGDLSSDIRQRIPDVDDQVAASEDFAKTVKRVIAGAVKRVLDNPKGLRQRTVSVDDFSSTETVDSTGSSGKLQLSDDDWDDLLPASSGDSFSIRFIPSPWYA